MPESKPKNPRLLEKKRSFFRRKQPETLPENAYTTNIKFKDIPWPEYIPGMEETHEIFHRGDTAAWQDSQGITHTSLIITVSKEQQINTKNGKIPLFERVKINCPHSLNQSLIKK